ncbi:MAG: hypothetical protein D6690_13630 [Nitrospirae bacterium]|nr:MAG: hypothetical protein D6690_13630 [Nitrospirota bacterium]
MKIVAYLGLVLLLVPLQMTIARLVNGALHPDLCLVAVCLIGFWGGWGRGFSLGLCLGFVQDLFSAGGLGINLLTKALAGLLSGYAATTLSTLTPAAIFFPTLALSMFVSVMALISASPQLDGRLLLHSAHTAILPRGLMDGALAFILNWIKLKMEPLAPPDMSKHA